MLRGKSRRVEVHCWGGLGSQLFALALIYDLQMRFPRRNFVLVLHSNGVTRRAQEISSLPFIPAYEFRDDFKLLDTSTQFSSKRSIVRKFIKKLMLRIGFLAEANDDSDYAHVKPWVRQIRGHYSRRLISLDFIRLLDSHLLARYGSEFKSPSAISVHYRLGDLLHLNEKSPIKPARLAREIYRAQAIYPGTTTLYSDSAQEAKALLGSLGLNALEIPSSSSPLDVLNFAKSSEFFIGTSSKISYWVVLLRIIKNNSQISSMPDSDKINLEPLLEFGHCQSINYYS